VSTVLSPLVLVSLVVSTSAVPGKTHLKMTSVMCWVKH